MYQVLVFLTAGPAGIESLRDFERKAMRVIESHGGRLVTAFVPEAHDYAEQADEIHLIEFPSKGDFLRYRDDPKIADLADERSAAIADSRLYSSEKFVSYESNNKTR